MKHAKIFQAVKPQKCMGKNCYNSRKEAEDVKTEQEFRDLSCELTIDIYRCQYCEKFHLTNTAK